MRARAGLALAEQVVAIGLLAVVLIVLAVVMVQTRRAQKLNRQFMAASALAHDVLDEQRTMAVDLVPSRPGFTGYFVDGAAYQVDAVGYPLGGPVGAGLTGQELKGLRVTVTWRDLAGPHTYQAETCMARIPR